MKKVAYFFLAIGCLIPSLPGAQEDNNIQSFREKNVSQNDLIMNKAFDTVISEVKRLRGKNPWTTSSQKLKFDDSSILDEALSQITKKFGPDAACALLNDCKEDDYIRQTAIKALLNYDYKIDHLTTLCEVIISINRVSKTVHQNDRRWIENEAAELKLASLVIGILDIDDSKTPSRMEFLKDERIWLKNTLSIGLQSSEDNLQKEKISQGLKKLDSL